MQIMLLLTAEQAARVRGPSDIDPDAVLDPIALPDGSFALPASVLDDPVHELHHQMLGTLPWGSMPPPEVAMAKRRPRTVGIIGAGFSGTMLAVHLIEMSSTPLKVILFDKSSSFAKGPAYATPNAKHLLNVRAANMSAYNSDPEHFVRWLAGDKPTAAAARSQDGFVSRGTYGRYLRATLEAACLGAKSGAHVVEIDAEVSQLSVGKDSVELVSADGRRFEVGCVALCIGNLPQALPVDSGFTLNDLNRCVTVPWGSPALDRIGPHDDVAIIGTGLTMVDVVLDLRSRGHVGSIQAFSRRGLLPVSHRDVPAYPPFLPSGRPPSTIRALLPLVRREVRSATERGVDWRSVLDALRPHTEALWSNLPATERRRFLRHVRPYWEVHRHRVAPLVGDEIRTLLGSGTLSVTAAKVVSLAANDREVTLSVRNRGAGNVRKVTVDWLVNCSGPQLDYRLIRDPLVNSLFASGLAQPDELNLGLKISGDYRLVGRTGTPAAYLFALGPPIRGALWETTAVPDIRKQCEALACHITDQSTDQSTDATSQQIARSRVHDA